MIERLKLFVFFQLASFGSIIWPKDAMKFIEHSTVGAHQEARNKLMKNIIAHRRRPRQQ